ncbi:cyclopropane-fatty-acyl-phospholipid synthase-like protein [Bradyrhizobiaceae bacterium SG-6C]|nr:cyclopropane-fatty-acyl-phospholipid synthase-like protein [Bradyrhizobiaceae bacterium SG-6C]
MSLARAAIRIGEAVPWPDALSRTVIDRLVGQTRRALAGNVQDTAGFAREMANYPVALHTDDANAQHYEIPAEFFALILGPQRKYSCCLYDEGIRSLAEAEENALRRTADHALLGDGQRILELGCGWGSLSLWMARHYPSARIVSVSNSHSQREYITERARNEELSNLEVITADMNGFIPHGQFDRIVSVEMFEHMANWRPLLKRVKDALNPDGRLFLHIFSHRSASYRFDHANQNDWIAQHFFTGGIMPGHSLIREFTDMFAVDAEWRWSGSHYEKTANDWLANFDNNNAAIFDILRRVYGADARIWHRRWRLFFLATAGLFGHSGGKEWGVSHYRLQPVS